jgi:hypothetical protein
MLRLLEASSRNLFLYTHSTMRRLLGTLAEARLTVGAAIAIGIVIGLMLAGLLIALAVRMLIGALKQVIYGRWRR